MTGKRYTIRTVEDFFLVPAERRELMLKEFGEYLHVTSELMLFAKIIGATMPTPTFQWIDDDKREAHLNIIVGSDTVRTTVNMERKA